MLAVALLSCTSVASTNETGSDGLPLNGMAPLYFTLPNGTDRAVSTLITLPELPTNKHWYANWVMIVGRPNGATHDAFVQVGLIRRPDQSRLPYVFCAWQTEQQPRIQFQQIHLTADGPHRFTILQIQNTFALIADGREVMRVPMSSLAQTHTTYAQVGPEVYAEGEALSGNVLYAAVSSNNIWKRVGEPDACRYENHGVLLRRTGEVWVSTGRFDRTQPSGFKGRCDHL